MRGFIKTLRGIISVRKHLGYIYHKKGNYQKAIKYVKKSIELDPKYLLAYYLLAKIYLKIGRYKQASNALEKCLEINPTSEYSKKLKVKLSNIKTESNLLQ